MSKNKLLALLISVLFSVFIKAQTEQGLALLITKTNGIEIVYNLSNFPVLSFENDMLNVSYEGTRNSYPWIEVKSLTYISESEIPNYISGIKNDNDFSVVYYDKGISISSNKKGVIRIFDINGKSVFSANIDNNNPLYIDFSLFSKGLYILSNGINSTKFYVK